MRHLALALSIFVTPGVFAQSPPSYRITHQYAVGGDGSWDYDVWE